MKNITLTITLLLCFGFAFSDNVYGQEEANATVTVNVKNLTPDGKDISNDIVTLEVKHLQQPVKKFESGIDKDGKALFEDIPVGPGFGAKATTKHSGMMFSSRAIELSAGQKAFEMEIEVYEISTDNSKFEVVVNQIVIKEIDGSLFLTEYVQIENPTGMAVTSSELDEAGRNKVISFYLPEGYKDLNMKAYFVPDAIVQTKDGFYDIMATPPGTHQTAFSYRLDITGKTMEIVKKFSMPTKDFVVYSQLGAGNLQGMGTPAGEMTLDDGTPALYYVISPCEKGQEIKLQLSGFDVKTQMDAVIIFSAVLGVVAVIAFIRAFAKKKS